jgi:hypothetical protein
MSISGVLLPSQARTVSTNSAEASTPPNTPGATFFVDASTIASTETIQLVIQGKDPASGDFFTLVSFTAISSAADWVYTVYPGAVETIANSTHEVQGLALPELWRARVVHSSTGSHVYSVSFSAP